MTNKVFSWDVESNGLVGKGFAIGAVVYDEDGNEIKQFYSRCPIMGEVDSFVEENVLPQMEELPVTHESYEEMLEAFASFFLENKEETHVIFHMGNPVEGRVIVDLHDFGFLGEFDGAYPWLDVAGCLLMAGEDPTSVDSYNAKHGIVVPEDKGGTHNPLYDARAAALCFLDLLKKI